MISIKNLTKSFKKQIILDDLSLEIKQGEIVVILGESGTGKSVLLKHIIGLLRPDKGTVTIGSDVISQLPESKLLSIRTNIGYLFQEGALYDFMNVYDNIAFPLREHTKLKEKEIKKKVADILKLIDLHNIEQKFPSELSGGMKKRVALARSIILESKVLCCDEPTSGLDPIRSRDISDLIKSISRKLNCTTVITSHDIANAFRIADRVVLIRQGKIVMMGSRDDFKKSEDPFVQKFIR